MLEGIEGATAIMDDIVIVGTDQEHHDAIFKRVLQRAANYNLQLNVDKCHVRQPEVSYVGHLITADGLKPDPEKTKAISQMPNHGTKATSRDFSVPSAILESSYRT